MLLFICFLSLGHLRELFMHLTKKTEVIDIQKPSSVCSVHSIESDKKVLALNVGNVLRSSKVCS